MTDPTPTPQAQYKDDDLVYVDPETKRVIGPVEWTKNEKPKSKAYVQAAPDPNAKTGKPERKSWRKHFPWGTYKSMKRIYKIEGKIKDPEPNKTLEEVLPKALNEAFWDWKEKEAPGEAPKAQ